MLEDKRVSTAKMMNSRIICAGYSINEKTVKEMLQFLGVMPTEEIIQEEIGYMSYNGLEFNLTNLFDFIQKNGYDKNCLDLRSKKN